MSQTRVVKPKTVPIFDENLGVLIDAQTYEKQENLRKLSAITQRRFEDWTKAREHLISTINLTADTIDTYHKRGSVSNILGSSVGVGGGALTIAGLVVMPPLALVGLAVSGVATVSNLVTWGVETYKTHEVVDDVQKLFDLDDKLFKQFAEAFELLTEAKEESAGESLDDGSASFVQPGIDAVSGVSKVGAAVAARSIILESSRLAPVALKGIAHGAAAAGIVLDVFTIATSVRDLIKDSKTDRGNKLRSHAEELQEHLLRVSADFEFQKDMGGVKEKEDAQEDEQKSLKE